MSYNSSIFQKGVKNTINSYQRPKQNSGRSFLNEVFDLLSIGQYATAGYATETLRAKNEGRVDPLAGVKGSARGIAQGLSIAPGWEGYAEPADYSYGKDVLTQVGWKPTSGVGKFAKGAVGFAGDVLLDPLTYVSLGGTSALKGSGKVGKEVIESSVKQLAEEGLEKASKEVAESLSSGGIKSLSKESAQDIVRTFSKKMGTEISEDGISKAADDFIKKYNNLLGQNRLGNKGATIGAQNLPFANKIFKDPSKYTFEFVSKETMEKLGDKTLAPYIDRITDSFYNSPLGKKFSTNTGLRELAKTNPEELYRTMEFLKYVGRANPTRVEQLQLTKKWFDDLGLTDITPYKQRQMIKAMTGKEVIKYLDVQTGKVSSGVEELYQKYINDIQGINDMYKGVKEGADGLVSARGVDLSDAIDTLGESKTFDIRKFSDEDILKVSDNVKKLDDSFANYEKSLDYVGIDNADDLKKALKLTDDRKEVGKVLKHKGQAFDGNLVKSVQKNIKTIKNEFLESMREAINSAHPEKYEIWSEGANLSDRSFEAVVEAYKKGGLDGIWNAINTNKKLNIELGNFWQMANMYSAQSVGVGRVDDLYKSGLRAIRDAIDTPEKFLDELDKYLGVEKTVAREITEDGIQAIEGSVKRGMPKRMAYMNEKVFGEELVKGQIPSYVEMKKKLASEVGESRAKEILSRVDKKLGRRAANRKKFEKLYYKDFLSRDKVARDAFDEKLVNVMKGTEFQKLATEKINAQNKIGNEIVNLNKDIVSESTKISDVKFEQTQKAYAGMLDENGSELFEKQFKKAVTDSDMNVKSEAYNFKQLEISRAVEDYNKNLFNKAELLEYEKLGRELNNMRTKFSKTRDRAFIDMAKEIRSEMNGMLEAKKLVKPRGKKAQMLKQMQKNIESLKAQRATLVANTDLAKAPDKVLEISDDILDVSNVSSLDKDSIKLAQDMRATHGESIKKMMDNDEIIRKAMSGNDEVLHKVDTGGSVPDEVARDMAKGDAKIKEISDAKMEIEVEDIYDTLSREEYIDKRIKTKIEGLTDVEAEAVTKLRREFIKLGEKEVDAGLLEAGQFAEHWGKYFPKLRTRAGAKADVKLANKDLADKVGTYVTSLFGYKQTGKMKSSMTSHVDDLIKYNDEKGFEYFMEDIANVYMARTMAHNDAFYQRGFAKDVVNNLGASAFRKGKYIAPKDGFKTGIAYGDLMDYVQRKARNGAMENLRIAKEAGPMTEKQIRDYIAEEVAQIKTNLSVEYGINFNDASAWGKPIVELSEESATKMAKGLGLEGRIKNLHNAQVDVFNHARNVEMAKNSSKLLNTYDKFLQLWKLNVTAIMPGFHTRNAVSNQFQNMLKIGSDITDPTLQIGATKTMKARMQGTKYAEEIVDGMTWDDLYEEAERVGAVGHGYFASDFEETKTAFDSIKELAQGEVNESFDDAKKFLDDANFNPFDVGNSQRPGFIGYEIGQETGSLIENRDRLLHYASLRRAGESAEAAAESVNKFLFDYDDLTVFEHTTMKRLFPFYTWMKKNTALQIEQAILQPEVYRNTSKLLNAIEGGESEPNNLPPWAEDYKELPFDIGEKDAFINPNLPTQDLNNLPANVNPVDYIEQLLVRSTPAIKAPVELALGKNMYFGSPINNKLDYLMSYFSAYSFGKQQMSQSRNPVDKKLNLLNKSTGIGIKRF